MILLWFVALVFFCMIGSFCFLVIDSFREISNSDGKIYYIPDPGNRSIIKFKNYAQEVCYSNQAIKESKFETFVAEHQYICPICKRDNRRSYGFSSGRNTHFHIREVSTIYGPVTYRAFTHECTKCRKIYTIGYHFRPI